MPLRRGTAADGGDVADGAAPTTAPSSVTDLLALLESVERGELAAEAAAERLQHLPFRELGFARIDTGRELRQGAPEGVLAEGKAPEEIEAIVRSMLSDGVSSVLVTRAGAEAREAVRRAAPDEVKVDERARLAWVARRTPVCAGEVTIVSGGTADGPVVREAEVRASLLGTGVTIHRDAGVAGPARLEPALADLRRADCVVVVAGLDAALASVVGGLVAAPVIGVPTSAGYGTAFGGVTPLLSMLSSCAAGLAVVGIDDGFGAGTIAARIARAAAGAV